uniref:Uncharacterized protein n=1 Tax=Seriola dumerili TaxID=41447 RepID=A0A3B4T6R0_SERDU
MENCVSLFGVIILILKNVVTKVYDQRTDSEGRWIALHKDIMGRRCSMLNIYPPNTDSPELFNALIKTIQNISNTDIIIGSSKTQCIRKIWQRWRTLHHLKFPETMSREQSLVDVAVPERVMGVTKDSTAVLETSLSEMILEVAVRLWTLSNE